MKAELHHHPHICQSTSVCLAADISGDAVCLSRDFSSIFVMKFHMQGPQAHVSRGHLLHAMLQ